MDGRLQPKSRLTAHLRHYALLGIGLSLFLGVVLLGGDEGGANWLGVLKYAWLSSLLFSAANLAGLVLYGAPREPTGAPQQEKLVVCYVSRGDNREALRRAVAGSRSAIEAAGAWASVYVITDTDVSADLDGLATNIVVPESYKTPRRARYKARALHYGIWRLSQKEPGWVLHLDEESQLTTSAVRGAQEFMARHRGDRVVGQGEIQYHGKGLLEAADMIRTGDDLGRFRAQYRGLGRPLFGIHGSFILAPVELEAELGFDCSPGESITEDTYTALRAWEQGVRFRWVDGVVREPSPHSIGDFLKQRRRWFCGLSHVARRSNLRPSTRLMLAAAILMWGVSWTAPLILLVDLAFPAHVWGPVDVLLAITAGAFYSTYLIGCGRSTGGNLLKLLKTGLLVPFAAALEAAAVVYALCRPVRTFEVISK